MGGEEIEEIAVLGPQDRLVIEELQHHEGADDVVLDRSGTAARAGESTFGPRRRTPSARVASTIASPPR